MQIYQQHVAEVLKQFNTSEAGLSSTEIKRRQKQYGRNQIKIRGEPLWRKLIEPFANVFMAVLFAAATISFFKGENLDGTIIASIISLSAIIYYVQRFSTERILRALQRYEAQKIETLRDGKTIELDALELVPGDIIILAEGEKVPADARIIHAENVRTDESLLTGESVPVSKQVNPLQETKQVYEQTNMLFQGSFIVAGQAKAVIVRTGNKTEFGQLAELSQSDITTSPVQQKIDKLITQIVIIVAGVALLAFTLSLVRGLEMAEALRFVLTLSVSAVPESLPVAITVVLVLGMRRMAKKKALVRNMRAIENIGVITTIATDKTGTLTKNKLTVQKAILPSGTEGNDVLAHHALLSVNQSQSSKLHDPLDSAMESFARQNESTVPSKYKLVTSIPFEHQYAMSGNVWHHDNSYLIEIKGAPERVLLHSKVKASQFAAIEQTIHSLTGQGFRVIALASGKLPKPIDSLGQLKKKDIRFVGLLAVADVLRKEARGAVLAAKEAGVSVRMITGDHFETAFSIGKQLGMAEHREQVFDSRQTAKLSSTQFSQAIANARVFSRVIPEDKHRILSVLKRKDITAMTGDGVNDVPALTNAHVGIAMGSGSQIAKEAGDIVLLNNNFSSIVAAMREGRVIYSNIRRMLFYLLSTNAGEVLTMVGALIIGMPLPLVAVQILWINLVTDTLLVIPLGLEPGEKNVMKDPPRSPKSPILDRFTIQRMILVAFTMAAVSLITFQIFRQSHGEEYARTLTFMALVVMQWANAFNARSERSSIISRLKTFNGKFYAGLTAAVLLQMIALFGPLKEALYVTTVSTDDLLTVSLAAIAVTFIVSELYKLIARLTKK